MEMVFSELLSCPSKMAVEWILSLFSAMYWIMHDQYFALINLNLKLKFCATSSFSLLSFSSLVSRERCFNSVSRPDANSSYVQWHAQDLVSAHLIVLRCALARNKTVSVVIRIWENCLLFKCTQSTFVLFQSIGLQGANNQTRTLNDYLHL